MSQTNRFLQHAGVKYPIIGGPMYPCSNPELVAAVSNAGGLGVIQPIALTYVHGYDLSDGIDYMQSLTQQALGMNLLIEKSAKKYQQKMQQYLDIALQKNIRFFITSLGKPDWVVERVHEAGGVVYHDVTAETWAKKAVDVGVDGLIAVNNRAGGHAGGQSFEALYETLQKFNVPLVCAGGVSSSADYKAVMAKGYQAVQMGTRFIASVECTASDAYKQAIIQSRETDIVLSERITGVPVSVINTKYIQQTGVKLNFLQRYLLQQPKLKYLMRSLMALRSLRSFKSAFLDASGEKDYWQAGKSVKGIHSVLSVEEIFSDLLK